MIDPEQRQLLDFAFFINDVFSNHGVVHFLLEFVRGSALVFVRGIEVARASGRIHADLVSHCPSPLNLFAASANISQHLLDTVLVDNAHALAGNSQAHEALLGLQPETVLVQVGQKTPASAVLRM
jgi:hypothetical protein